MDFTELAKEIVAKFEEDVLWMVSSNDYKGNAESLMLYLAAMKYLERYN